jgi:tetratricopeptide (TPR) repeat protein
MKWFFCILSLIFNTELGAQSFLDTVFDAQLKYKSKDFEQSFQTYKRAAAMGGDKFKAESSKENLNLELAQAAYRVEAYDDAVDYYQAVVKGLKNPIQQSAIYHNIGNAYLRAGKVEDAIEHYKTSIKLNGTDLETKSNLSKALRMKKSADEDKKNAKKDASNSNKEESQEGASKNKSPEKEYSFEAQQKKQILNQLLRKEAETKRRIEEKRGQSSKKSKDW